MKHYNEIPVAAMRRELRARRYADGGGVGVFDTDVQDIPEDKSAPRSDAPIPSLQNPKDAMPSMHPDQARRMKEMLEAEIRAIAAQAKSEEEAASNQQQGDTTQARARAEATKAKLVELLQAHAALPDTPEDETPDQSPEEIGQVDPARMAELESQWEAGDEKQAGYNAAEDARWQQFRDIGAGMNAGMTSKPIREGDVIPPFPEVDNGQVNMPYDPLDPIYRTDEDILIDNQREQSALPQNANAMPQNEQAGVLQQMSPQVMQQNIAQASPEQPQIVQNALPVAQAAAARQAAPEAVIAPVTGMQKIMSDYKAKKDALEAKQEEILRSLEGRVNDPASQLFALARGFGAPNPTGAFGNAFGSAMGAMADYRAKSLDEAQQIAKMRMEMAKTQMQDIREEAGMGMMGDILGPSTAAPSGAPARAGAGAQAGGMQNVTAEHLARLSMFNPKMAKALEDAIKMDMDRYVISANGIVLDKRTGKFIAEVPPFQEQKSYNIPGRGTFMMTPAQYEEIMRANAEGRGEEAFNRVMAPLTSGAAVAQPTQPSGELPEGGAAMPQERPLSEEEKKIRATEKAAEAEAKGKAAALTREGIYTAGENSFNTRQNAEAIMYLAKAHPKAFGPLAKTGFWPAILGAAQEGISLGSIGRIGISGLGDAIIKLGGTQADVDAGQAAARYMTELELSYRRTYLQGQGAVSNMEGEIIKKVGPSLSDSPKTLLIKSELIKDRAVFDAENSRTFSDWEERNPGKSIVQYKNSPEFRTLRNQLDKKMGATYRKYFPEGGKASPRAGGQTATADSLNSLVEEFKSEQ